MESLYDILYKELKLEKIDDDFKRRICEVKLKKVIAQLMDLDKNRVSCLSIKQTLFLRKKYGLLDNEKAKSQNEIAREEGVSRQAVSQYIQAGLKNIDKEIRRVTEEEFGLPFFSKDIILDQNIQKLNFSQYVVKELNQRGIFTIAQLASLYINDLKNIRGISPKIAAFIISKIHSYDIYFKDEELLLSVEREQDSKTKQQKAMQLPIEILGFSGRTYRALKRNGINFAGDITDCSTMDLMKMRDIGSGTCQEIGKTLNRYGLSFGHGETSEYVDEVLTDVYEGTQQEQQTLIPIEKLNLTKAVYNALKRSGIHFVQDITKYDAISLYGIDRIGHKGVLEIINKIETLGVNFKSAVSIDEAIEQIKMYKEQAKLRYIDLSREHEYLIQREERLTNEIKTMLRRAVPNNRKNTSKELIIKK